jgi:hypothetical protein
VAGQTLSSTNGAWTGSPTSFRYMWTWEDFGTDTSPSRQMQTNVVLASDVGHQLGCSVWATNAAGESVRVHSNLTAVVA